MLKYLLAKLHYIFAGSDLTQEIRRRAFTQSDADAIASDVAVVGDDMRAAMKKFKIEHPEVTDWPEDRDA